MVELFGVVCSVYLAYSGADYEGFAGCFDDVGGDVVELVDVHNAEVDLEVRPVQNDPDVLDILGGAVEVCELSNYLAPFLQISWRYWGPTTRVCLAALTTSWV